MDAVHVVGAGGIGCAVGSALLAVGVPVVFVEADEAKVAAGRVEGVSVGGGPARPAPFERFDDWEPPAGALVLLCTKCYDNAAVLSRLRGDVELVPIQNGFDPALHRRAHAFEGIASFVAACAPGRPSAQITRPGDLHLGSRGVLSAGAGLLPESLARLAATDLFRVVTVADIEPFKHAKLMYNAAISPLAAAAGFDNGALLRLPAARRLFFGLLAENHAILAGSGIRLGKVGPFHPRTVARLLRCRSVARLLARVFEPSLRGTYCSMAGEIERGRTELDNYNGHLIALAERAGIPCPLNRAVYARAAAMTARRDHPDPGAWLHLAA